MTSVVNVCWSRRCCCIDHGTWWIIYCHCALFDVWLVAGPSYAPLMCSAPCANISLSSQISPSNQLLMHWNPSPLQMLACSEWLQLWLKLASFLQVVFLWDGGDLLSSMSLVSGVGDLQWWLSLDCSRHLAFRWKMATLIVTFHLMFKRPFPFCLMWRISQL